MAHPVGDIAIAWRAAPRYDRIMASAQIDLTLTPNRSLDRRHSRWLIAGVGGVFLLMGVRLLFLGAWPVIPFMIADVLLLIWAFRASYRSGRAYEWLRIEDGWLTLCRVSAYGQRQPIRFDPDRTVARLERISEDQNRLWLASGAQRASVGAFLSPAEREALYPVLAAGLARWRAAQRSGRSS
jgi:uncharacterized membrane protein